MMDVETLIRSRYGGWKAPYLYAFVLSTGMESIYPILGIPRRNMDKYLEPINPHIRLRR